jgi:hypothetical protein
MVGVGGAMVTVIAFEVAVADPHEVEAVYVPPVVATID